MYWYKQVYKCVKNSFRTTTNKQTETCSYDVVIPAAIRSEPKCVHRLVIIVFGTFPALNLYRPIGRKRIINIL